MPLITARDEKTKQLVKLRCNITVAQAEILAAESARLKEEPAWIIGQLIEALAKEKRADTKPKPARGEKKIAKVA